MKRRLFKDQKTRHVAIALSLIPCLVYANPGIEEINVVAQKRVQSLQDVPLAVSVLSDRQILEYDIQDMVDVAEHVGSFSVHQSTGPINANFHIRRIGNLGNIPNFEPAVGLFVDGAFRSRSGVGLGDLYDLQRIEVLRGPQTTLYGKNTTAGLVAVYTKPPAEKRELFAEVSVGQIEGSKTADLVGVKVGLNSPITSQLSGRLSGAYFDHGHTMTNLFVDDDSESMQRYSLRAQLLYSLPVGLTARLILGRFAINSASVGEFEIDEGIAIAEANARFGVPCPANDSKDRAFCNNRAVSIDLEANDATLIVDYERAGYTLTSISGYEDYDRLRDFDADQLNVNLLDVFDRQHGQSYSQELRIVSPAGDVFDWLGGLYYFHNDFTRGDPSEAGAVLGAAAPLFEFRPGVPAGQQGDAGFLTSQTRSEHFSMFASATWHFAERGDVTFGGRWQSEDKHSVIVNAANHTRPTVITSVLAPPQANADIEREIDAFTWNVNARYRWSRSAMTYLSVAKGFKSGGFNAGFSLTPGASREFDDEKVISYELGMKAAFAQNRVQARAAIFKAEYDDYQSAGFVSLRFRVNNAERVDVAGVELDVDAHLHEQLTASMSISYVKAEYGRYTRGACYFGRAPDNLDGTGCILTDATLPLAPKWKSSATLAYQRRIGMGTAYANLHWAWSDRYHTNATLDPRHIQDAYSLINLRGGFRFANYDISIWARNIGNETFVMQDGPTNLFPQDPGFARFLGPPRSWGLTLRASW